MTDITEHSTAEGKVYMCAAKDAFSGRIVGYAIDSRTKSRLVVRAIENAVAMRGNVAGCIVHRAATLASTARCCVDRLNSPSTRPRTTRPV